MTKTPYELLNELNQKGVIPKIRYEFHEYRDTKFYLAEGYFVSHLSSKRTKARGISKSVAKYASALKMCQLLNVSLLGSNDQFCVYKKGIKLYEWHQLCQTCKKLKQRRPIVKSNSKLFILEIPGLKLKSKANSLICCCIELLLKLEGHNKEISK